VKRGAWCVVLLRIAYQEELIFRCRLRLAAGDFEDLVHFFDEEFVFGVGEIAVDVEFF
jgi:hypothetical protein